MSWNHRVLRTKDEGGEWFAIHEVYYNDEDGSVKAWTSQPVSPSGETLDVLKKELEMFTRALDKPVLDVAEIEAASKARARKEKQEST